MYTYLLVDDELLTRKGTIKKLEGLSEQISCIGEAENGMDALEKVRLLNPDIIITDMNMPIMDGTQLLPLLTEQYPDKPLIVISSYKDFEYMYQALKANTVDYILKPFGKKEIQSCVLRAIGQLENKNSVKQQLLSSESEREAVQYQYDLQLLSSILLGYRTASTELISRRLKYINDTHKFILITLHSSDCLNEIDLRNFLCENDFGDLAICLPNENTPNMAFLILFIPESPLLNTQSFCRQIIQNLILRYEQELKTLSFGVSDEHSDLSELHTAFSETVNALNAMPPQEGFAYSFYSSAPAGTTSIAWEKEEEFLFRLESGMTAQISCLLDELFTYCSTSGEPLCNIKYYFFQLATQAQAIMAEYIEQVNPDSSSLSMQNILNTMFTLNELQKYYVQFFCNIAIMLKECSVYSTNDAIEKVKIYVNKNYKNNLTIEFISSLLYMNRSYLSHLFKEKTGEKFVDYLNDIRIEKAKELLSKSDKKMYAIAKAVGYDNVKYFFRIFKRKTGMTPEQYRLH